MKSILFLVAIALFSCNEIKKPQEISVDYIISGTDTIIITGHFSIDVSKANGVYGRKDTASNIWYHTLANASYLQEFEDVEKNNFKVSFKEYSDKWGSYLITYLYDSTKAIIPACKEPQYNATIVVMKKEKKRWFAVSNSFDGKYVEQSCNEDNPAAWVMYATIRRKR